MAVLTSSQRSSFEKTVVGARKAAEVGARNALISLAVDQPTAFASMDAEQRSLRNQLRTKARLLGDTLVDGVQSIEHLVTELAYEYWHKMLFARFLEANDLLMHPEGVAVSMADCEEFAVELGMEDKWEVASIFASKMLPAIFRPNDPVLQVRFASNDRINLESILDDVEGDIFRSDDALGWVYQFWQNEAKAEINASGDKIDRETLPAVTQLFTEPYMVQFLIDNTIGAWWVSRHPNTTHPFEFEYLRKDSTGKPIAGSFDAWTDKCANLKILDPCMGSGHFIASLLKVIAKLRAYEEGESIEYAVDRTIIDNIHGLEIDPRCTQIAAFNLALSAWSMCDGYRDLPKMNLACSGIAPNGRKEEWVNAISGDFAQDTRARIENGMMKLFDHFQHAPDLGSLLEPETLHSDAFTADYSELQSHLINVLLQNTDGNESERGVIASGIAHAGLILSNKYDLVITNYPFLGRGKHDAFLMKYADIHYPESKSDLAMMFVQRVWKLLDEGGIQAFVSPQAWLFSADYLSMRQRLLKEIEWLGVVKLGTRAFETLSGEVVNVGLYTLRKYMPTEKHMIYGLDVSGMKNGETKALGLLSEKVSFVTQKSQYSNPESRITLSEQLNVGKLGDVATGYEGSSTGDKERYLFYFWEVDLADKEFEYFQSSPDGKSWFSGCRYVVFWERGEGSLSASSAARIQGLSAFGKCGVLIGRIGGIRVSNYEGHFFDKSCVALIPQERKQYLPISLYAQSSEFSKNARELDPRLAMATSVFEKMPFDKERWQEAASSENVNDYHQSFTDDPTQWLYNGNPKVGSHSLHVCVLRLLGFRYPAEYDDRLKASKAPSAGENTHISISNIVDEDGIVCIPPVNGEPSAVERMRSVINTLYSSEWDHTTISDLIIKEGYDCDSLKKYLFDEWFDQHCMLFQNRPFIWHIWDGRKDGFSLLVNYHKLDKEALQRLIYTYLGDWIRQCEAKRKAGESGAEGFLSAAHKLKEKLEAILTGEPPYDIFVRWKPLHEQPIGWEPDLNDGVRINIRPFIEAGILRKKVKIKYGIDRGKNPAGSPWGEIRDNDRHLTLEEKRTAREKMKS